ncbi:hypothetical protein CYMTET_7765 [Cymbomonas tetramitiformis]|uniref:Uncharacterized protein n=1 Tax=Cymbomonas tetramitiformis TaxID=36881 RepID=A0AAE0LGJ6_9CHLO|nr:hypothetical protein CYMTET_7765 [Cymbomonas tetramitiformis]
MATVCPPTKEFPGGVELIPVRHQPSAQPPTHPIPGQQQPQRYPRGPGRQGSFGLGHLHTLTVLALLCMAMLPAVAAGSSVFQAAPDLQLQPAWLWVAGLLITTGRAALVEDCRPPASWRDAVARWCPRLQPPTPKPPRRLVVPGLTAAGLAPGER